MPAPAGYVRGAAAAHAPLGAQAGFHPAPQEDGGGFATALAEQAKAMAAMANMFAMRGEAEDTIGELALPPGLHGRGARGTAALHAWRRAFLEKPQAVSARIRANRNRVMTGLMTTPDSVPSMRGYFAAEVPFGQARTAAYLTFGMADVADLMEASRWHEAEALVLLLLSASETAALQDWQWGLAWTLTFASEPPWARIRAHPPASSELRGVGRLVDPELLAAAVGHLKDMMAINEAQRKVAPSGGARPQESRDGTHSDSKGRGKRGDRKPWKGGEPAPAAAGPVKS